MQTITKRLFSRSIQRTPLSRVALFSSEPLYDDTNEAETPDQGQPLSTFSPSQMDNDKRYAASQAAPESLFKPHHSDFSIRGQFREGRAAYLDMQSTTPMDPRVMDAMLPFMLGSFGNPHSRTHQFGWESETVVETSREKVAQLIGASSKEIVFTSGATESNNLAVKGAAHFYKNRGKHVITTQTEHKCVLDSCRSLEEEGFKVTYLPVQQSTGRIDMEELKAATTDETTLISVMAINNEIGTLQPLKEIGAFCKERKIVFHTDAAQMLGMLHVAA